MAENYRNHKVFSELDNFIRFYKDLSILVFRFAGVQAGTVFNIDTYVYSSMSGTLESIRAILYCGRINDSFTLLRKFWDLTVINNYTNLYITENTNYENLTAQKIADWVKGKEKLPSFNKMSAYLINSPQAQELTKLIYDNKPFIGSRFESIRSRCNNHTHYNYYQSLLDNDNEITRESRLETLSQFRNDVEEIIFHHLSYLFLLNEHYLASTDYTDSFDLGQTPAEGEQYIVAPFIQEIFSNLIKTKNPQVADLIKSRTSMRLE